MVSYQDFFILLLTPAFNNDNGHYHYGSYNRYIYFSNIGRLYATTNERQWAIQIFRVAINEESAPT